jgi:hypothetical protein
MKGWERVRIARLDLTRRCSRSRSGSRRILRCAEFRSCGFFCEWREERLQALVAWVGSCCEGDEAEEGDGVAHSVKLDSERGTERGGIHL